LWERTGSVYTGSMAGHRPWLSLVCALSLSFAACTSVGSDLRTASDLYRDARYEAASAWLDALQVEEPSMTRSERGTFHYLRGMTAYRLARYQDALHSLSLAANAVNAYEGALTPTQRSVLDRTLADLTPPDASPHARSPRERGAAY
jgi:hypothetical protein